MRVMTITRDAVGEWDEAPLLLIADAVPSFYEEADGYREDDRSDAEEDAEDDAFAGVEECGEVDGADDGEDSGHVEI